MATELINPSGNAGAAPGNAEPCPAPLEWRVVLAEFRSQCLAFEGRAGDGGERITGRMFGSGRPLYFLGPAAGDHDLFALLAWLLKDECACVFVDLPTIGWPVRAATELPRQSRAIVAAAESLGHERFSLLGVAAGSSLALDLALNHPDLVQALVLLQGSARAPRSWLERGYCSYGSLLRGGLARVPGWRRLQRQNHRRWFPPFDGSRFDFLLENLGQSPVAQVSRRLQLWASLDFRNHLADVKSPTLLIQTEGEGAPAAAAALELQAALPNVSTEELHSAGLYPYLTHPHRVAKLLRMFLREELAPRVP